MIKLRSKTRIQFEWVFFLISFAVGISFVYFFTPKPQVIMKMPSPYSPDDVFNGEGGGCYKFDHEVVECTDNAVVQKPGETFPVDS